MRFWRQTEDQHLSRQQQELWNNLVHWKVSREENLCVQGICWNGCGANSLNSSGKEMKFMSHWTSQVSSGDLLNVAAVPHLGALGTVRPLSASSLHFLSSMSPILLKVNKFITSDTVANATAGFRGWVRAGFQKCVSKRVYDKTKWRQADKEAFLFAYY